MLESVINTREGNSAYYSLFALLPLFLIPLKIKSDRKNTCAKFNQLNLSIYLHK